jgi:hypothetical protein
VARKDEYGVVRNAVLILHGTTGRSEAWGKLAMIHLMVRRLVKKLSLSQHALNDPVHYFKASGRAEWAGTNVWRSVGPAIRRLRPRPERQASFIVGADGVARDDAGT